LLLLGLGDTRWRKGRRKANERQKDEQRDEAVEERPFPIESVVQHGWHVVCAAGISSGGAAAAARFRMQRERNRAFSCLSCRTIGA
jgi:hypothetical protein